MICSGRRACLRVSVVAGSPREESVRTADVLATAKRSEDRVACELMIRCSRRRRRFSGQLVSAKGANST
jgi:hypothetical protein